MVVDIKMKYSGKKDSFGFKVFTLELRNNGKVVDKVSCLSGSPAAQARDFVHPSKDFAGSGNPIPEGVYKIAPMITQNWNEPGIGFKKIPLDVLGNYDVNNRSEFLFHDDVNRVYARGSLGCVVFYSQKDFERVAGWCKQVSRPTILVVDYGVGFLASRGYKDPIPESASQEEEKQEAPKMPTTKKKRVLLERGHGPHESGFEPGAISNERFFTEYQLNGFVCEQARQMLVESGFDVTVSDSAKSLYRLGLEAQGYDCFVSVHHNAFNESVQGTEVLIHESKSESADAEFAKFVLASLVKNLGLPNRGVKKQPLGVLSGAEDTNVKACCLSEGYFISCSDLTVAKINEYTQKYAKGLAEGIASWLLQSKN